MKKSLAFLWILTIILPLAFVGCSGNDGATGAAGIPGAPGPPGTPGPPGAGILASESCIVCHAEGRIADVAGMHNPSIGTATATITGVTFNPDNAVVAFTFTATDSEGNPVPDNILLTPSGSNLAYARFTIAKLVPGLEFPGLGGTYRTANEWSHYGPRSHRSPSQLTFGGGVYTFTFVDNVALDPAQAGYTHRVGIEIYGIPGGVRSINPTFTFVPNGSAVTTTRDIVTTAACNECHDPLGYTPRFHGSRRVDTKYCGLCHNSNNPLAPQAAGGDPVPIPFAKLVHGIHTAQDLLIFENGENIGDFTEITYPEWQDIRNCTKCHKGAGDSGNWRTVPSIVACGSCHTDVNFATGAGHLGGAQTNLTCGLCHNPDLLDIEVSHRTLNATPNNPNVPSGLAVFKYFIDNVAVNGAGVASVTFRIQKNGAPLDLSTYPPTGFTGGPSFLLAWALLQDGIDAPADYNNRNSPATPSASTGNGAGDAPSVSLASVAGSLTVLDNTAKQYRVSLTSSPFPAGAKMRAVAMQSYFTQTAAYDENGDGVQDNIGRHTPSVVMAVPGDTTRRQVVKSGYDPVTGEPIGCLECHETIEGHGGSRVNNVQLCVFCHNPNKSSSGRTVDPANINPEVVAALGSDPLIYPEATLNFKNMIHGIHRASTRPYQFVRNFRNGSYYNWSDVTFPGDLKHCTKCHIGDSYRPENLPAGVLYNVERTTTGRSSETRTDIIAARASVPNSTDLVDSPIAGACYFCHDSVSAKSHMVLNGGKIGSTRTDALAAP